VLTDRGRSLLLLGGLVYVGAWAFGAQALYPLAVGLVLAVLAAALWVRLLRRPMRLRRSVWRGEHLAGDDVRIGLELDVLGWMPPVPLVAREEIGRLGEQEAVLQPRAGGLSGGYVVPAVPRGRYPIVHSEVVIEDPFGLERTEVRLSRPSAILVYPRLVEVETLFSDAGGRTPGGHRLLMRRTSGFELHSVREYEQGESLRRIHWPSTARRGELMVKELEDSPRDETAVFLDADAASVVGEAPDSTFELQVRAAGSIVRAQAKRSRRAALIVNSSTPAYQRINSLDGDWHAALEVLAAVQADGRQSAAISLSDESGPAARALELTVVTASLTARLVDRLLQRMLSRHAAALVYVDPQSFATGPAEGERRLGDADVQLLRLERGGVPVLVLRREDDLATRLAGERPAHVEAASPLAAEGHVG
jgi:uncharacterized protein (DUF58 family)